MDEFQVWAIAILMASTLFIWFVGYDDGPNAHSKTPRKEKRKHIRK